MVKRLEESESSPLKSFVFLRLKKVLVGVLMMDVFLDKWVTGVLCFIVFDGTFD